MAGKFSVMTGEDKEALNYLLTKKIDKMPLVDLAFVESIKDLDGLSPRQRKRWEAIWERQSRSV